MEDAQVTKENPLKGKKILIDTTFLFDQYSFRGIGKYGKEVIKRLIKPLLNEGVELGFVGFLNLQKNLIELGFSQFSVDQYVDKIKFYSLGEPVLSGVSNVKRWSKTFKPVIETSKPDLFFSVNFERGLPSVKLINKKLLHKPKVAVMAHDAIPLATNNFSAKSKLHNKLKGIFYKVMFSGIKNADLVLTNSNYSKGDLIKFGEVQESKIKVIYLGVDESFAEFNNPEEESSTLKAYNLESKNYFVYDSGLESNKGIDDLIKIFKNIKLNNIQEIPTKLLLIGKDFSKGTGLKIKPKNERASRILKILKTENILENIVTTDRVSDQDLIILIKNAFCYFNFSKYEGFGFGPIQAMSAKVPAIVGNFSCTPEITDGGAFMVDTLNLEEASTKIKEYLSNKSEIKKYIEKGFKIAQRYNWDNTADQTLKEFTNLLSL